MNSVRSLRALRRSGLDASVSAIFAAAFFRHNRLPQSRQRNDACKPLLEPTPAIASPEEQLTPRDVGALNEQFSRLGSAAALAWAWERFGARAAIGTSFQGAWSGDD